MESLTGKVCFKKSTFFEINSTIFKNSDEIEILYAYQHLSFIFQKIMRFVAYLMLDI